MQNMDKKHPCTREWKILFLQESKSLLTLCSSVWHSTHREVCTAFDHQSVQFTNSGFLLLCILWKWRICSNSIFIISMNSFWTKDVCCETLMPPSKHNIMRIDLTFDLFSKNYLPIKFEAKPCTECMRLTDNKAICLSFFTGGGGDKIQKICII